MASLDLRGSMHLVNPKKRPQWAMQRYELKLRHLNRSQGISMAISELLWAVRLYRSLRNEWATGIVHELSGKEMKESGECVWSRYREISEVASDFLLKRPALQFRKVASCWKIGPSS